MKKVTLLLLFVLSGTFAFGQYYYLTSLPGNPGGLNNDGEATFTNMPAGWSGVQAGSNTPVWSPNQTIPFSFMFNGTARTSYKVSTTGVLTFDVAATSVPSTSNASLPSTSIPDNSICVWGLEVAGGNNNDYIASKTFGTAPNRQHWVSFLSASNPNENQQNYTYWSIVLEETSGKVYVVDQQHRRAPSLTVGLQLNSTSAVIHPATPSVSNLAGNDNTAADNRFYTFAPGIQPGFDLAGISLIMNDVIALPSGPFDIYGAFINLGFAQVTSVEINYSINGGPTVTGNVSGLSISKFAQGNIFHPTKWTPSGLGNYTIKMWASQINGSPDFDTANDTITFNVTVANTVSINENEIDGLNIYPNPANDFVVVELENGFDEIDVRVMNLLGQEVMHETYNDASQNIRLNTTKLKPAVYLVKVTTDGKTSTRRISIQ